MIGKIKRCQTIFINKKSIYRRIRKEKGQDIPWRKEQLLPKKERAGKAVFVVKTHQSERESGKQFFFALVHVKSTTKAKQSFPLFHFFLFLRTPPDTVLSSAFGSHRRCINHRHFIITIIEQIDNRCCLL